MLLSSQHSIFPSLVAANMSAKRVEKGKPGPPAKPIAPDAKKDNGAVEGVTYVCQKCRKVIQITPKATFSDSLMQDVQKSFDWTLVSPHLAVSKSGEDFSVAMAQLLDFTAEITQEDQPLCFECTRGVIDGLERKLKEAEREHEEYNKFLTSLREAESEETGGTDGAAYEAVLAGELLQLENEERQLLGELERVHQQREELRKEAALVAEEKADLERQTATYWRSCNQFITEDTQLNERKASLEQRLQAEREELEKLTRTNILNEAFPIWFDGNFGTINNFRLGKLQSVPVEWNEINAAWGHAALLLSTIQRQNRIPSTKYRIKPMGSFSVVEKAEGNGSVSSFELFGGATVFWASNRFDKAMTGYLQCLEDAIQHELATCEDKSLTVPYPIHGEKVGGLSIKLVSMVLPL
eukprot:TRINITY_DN8067_c0_g1_i1.p2 TRINITY_DN8067_c0_g1~~TRINITY_DN8067_c0_g1_i1.p2  ORF type:complete len:411 (+),score=97.05 TRINITY_DN8067_c0_g1_i1:3661-4893(+)